MMRLRTAVLAALMTIACGPDPLSPDSSLDTLPSGLSPAPATVAGQNVTCTNLSLGDVAVADVVVPAGATCQLVATRLTGSLKAGAGSVLDGRDITLAGNLQADGAAAVKLTGQSRVGGSIQLVKGGEAWIAGATVQGDVQLDELLGAVSLDGNQVRGNVQVKDNRGAVAITGNRITGNLQCEGNLVRPGTAMNSAASFEGQCSGGTTSGAAGPTTRPARPPTGNVTCSGISLGAFVVDTVTVPAGQSCTLEGTQLLGSLEVGARATVSADGVAVVGNLVADGATQVRVTGASRVGGSVQLKRGQSATLLGTSVSGDVQVDAMTGPVALAGLRVGGNVQVMSNEGGVTVSASSLRGALQCKDNRPAPTGSGNVAAIKEDQCQSL